MKTKYIFFINHSVVAIFKTQMLNDLLRSRLITGVFNLDCGGAFDPIIYVHD